MNKKGLNKALSFIMVLALVLPALPARTIKAAENPVINPTEDVSTVTPSAISMMATVSENTSLSISDGPITITNQSYVQTNSSGTVINSGDITGELVLTGVQANNWPITLSGSNIPTIHYKNVVTNGNIKGTASGTLNIILEGNCTFSNSITYSLTNISTVNLTGVEGNLCKTTGVLYGDSTSVPNLFITGIKVDSNSGVNALIQAYRNISVTDCTYVGAGSILIQNIGNIGNSYTATVKDCIFNSAAFYFGSNTLIENVKILNQASTAQINISYAPYSNITIKDSVLYQGYTGLGGSTVKIINSFLSTGSYYVDATYITGSFYIEGSTIVSKTTSTGIAGITMSKNNAVFVTDSSILVSPPFDQDYGFYNSISKTMIDPYDTQGNVLYLNMVKVPGASNAMVTVSIDDRPEVTLGTDSNGYLFLYLPTGQHNVYVTDINNNHYTKTFTSTTARPTTSTSNVIGELDPAKAPTDIITPYFNTSIQYSFNYSNWSNATTDGTGIFKAVIPDNATRIYIKVSGEIKHAIISDGVVGTFYADKPIITEQSNSDITFLKGMQGTVYVNSVPYTIGDTLTYQWYKDGELLSGKTSPVLNLSVTNVSDAGTYTCIIKESDGRTITSSPITVVIHEGQPEEEGQLTIVSQSSDKTLIKGYSMELYVNAKPSLSSKELTYQWYKDGAKVPDAVSSKLNIGTVVLVDSGTYVCRVYEDSNYLDSDPIIVTVKDNPLEGDVTDLTNQVVELTSLVGTLQGQLVTANQEKATLENRINELDGQIENYINQISELQSDTTELQQQLQDANGDKESLNQMITDLNNQINGLNDQIHSLQMNLEAVNTEKETLEQTVSGLQTDITNLSGQITLLQGLLSDSEAANTELTNQVTELLSTIAGLENQVTDLQNGFNALSVQNGQLISQVESLTEQKSELDDDIQRLLGLLDDAYGTIDNLTGQVANLTARVNTLTEQLANANQGKDTLQETIDGLESEITNLNIQITTLQTRALELEEALEQAGAEKDTLKQTITGLNTHITNLNETVTSFQNQINVVTAERDALLNTVTGLNTQIVSLNSQITIISGKLEDSEEKNMELINQVTELHGTISELESNITGLQSELDSIQDSNIKLQGQLNTANQTINSLNALLALIKGELGIVNDDDIIPAIKQLKEQLQHEKVNNSFLQEQLDELNTELATARESNITLTEKIQELINLVDSEDFDGLKSKIIELQTSLTESVTRIHELELEKSTLLKNLEEAEQLNQTLQQKLDELLKLSDSDVLELKQQILALTSQMNQLIQKNQDLQTSISDLTIRINDLNTEKAKYESEIVRLETLLNTANSTIEELRLKLANLAADKILLENENEALKEKIQQIIKQLENSNHSSGGNSGSSNNTAEVKDLKDKLDQAVKNLETTKQELEKLKETTGKTDGKTDGKSDGNTDGKTDNKDIKLPENSIVIMPAKTVAEPVIKQETNKPIKDDKIVAEDGWEIAPTLDSDWTKEISLIDTIGQTNKPEKTNYKFYAREEEKPEQIYTQLVTVERPEAIPNFTMDKLIYLGSEFNLNVANISKDAKITYKSADNSVAKINKEGKITPVKEGKTQITGTVTKAGIPYRFTVKVTVKSDGNKTLNLKDQAIQTASNTPVLLVYKLVNKDKTTKINLNGYAKNATVSYISSDSTIATVDKAGIIKGIKKGTTTITATLAQNNTMYTYIIKVRVDDGTNDETKWNYLTDSSEIVNR
ncbi:Ig-like domain-containing protein [Anaerocolumna sp. AGMB13025]|uniref:Ig-like domain-containing protein n=1 Tax=Anaerocolumna sp. AGMB13025 TaxID=3039116 RepID=UPI00241CB2AA|nr:Ig-like domain-containing protein [Anaerocolumna sp. AGMB13025]WFR59549.1 Ig-like domain-containing protein [Anaerocolumna sp. AGMB13025]